MSGSGYRNSEYHDYLYRLQTENFANGSDHSDNSPQSYSTTLIRTPPNGYSQEPQPGPTGVQNVRWGIVGQGSVEDYQIPEPQVAVLGRMHTHPSMDVSTPTGELPGWDQQAQGTDTDPWGTGGTDDGRTNSDTSQQHRRRGHSRRHASSTSFVPPSSTFPAYSDTTPPQLRFQAPHGPEISNRLSRPINQPVPFDSFMEDSPYHDTAFQDDTSAGADSQEGTTRSPSSSLRRRRAISRRDRSYTQTSNTRDIPEEQDEQERDTAHRRVQSM